jgi:radical SAM protein with 4Fe4S-binding SPASM domain
MATPGLLHSRSWPESPHPTRHAAPCLGNDRVAKTTARQSSCSAKSRPSVRIWQGTWADSYPSRMTLTTACWTSAPSVPQQPSNRPADWSKPCRSTCDSPATTSQRRTLDRISIFPDGRAYVCSFLFDTDLHFANMVDGRVVLNKEANEFDLFTRVLRSASCGSCKVASACMGGCPAEELVMGQASCAAEPDIVPVCRLWKADVPTGLPN